MEKNVYVELKSRINWLEGWYKEPSYKDLMADRIGRLIEHNKIRVSRHMKFGPLQKVFAGKSFVYKFDKYNWWGFTTSMTMDAPFSYELTNLFQVKSSMGTIYFKAVGEEVDGKIKPRYEVFTQHFMERMQQRLRLTTTEAAVKVLIKEKLEVLINARAYTAAEQPGRKGLIYLPLIIGGALGEKFNDIILFKTFITDEQMDEWQSAAAKKLRVPRSADAIPAHQLNLDEIKKIIL